MFISFIIFAAASVTTSDNATSPKPANNPGTWVTPGDYPPEALKNRATGDTSFRLTIRPDGLVRSCVITGSSGSSVLDEATCRNVVRRARFHPARDENGNPASGTWQNKVRWQIPENATSMTLPNEFSDSSTLTLVREKDGSVSSCNFDKSVTVDQKKLICEKAELQFGRAAPNEKINITIVTTVNILTTRAEPPE